MKLNEPVGDARYGPLFVRIPLGAYFVLASLGKLNHAAAFVDEVRRFHVLPDQLGTLYGILLPYVELTVGFFLLLGIWTTLCAVLAALMMFSFTLAFGFFHSGVNIFNKDILVLGGALSLLFTGAGAYSVDSFRKSG
jgi:uncharacterized membrane protein YphA (DoxX/SURF4 family)